ncbi:MAG: glycosyltransferase [Phycisphaerales bacterium]
MTPLRVLLVTAGSAGDIHPFLSIGRALMARGHTVTMLVNRTFEGAVREAGLGFAALGEEAFDFSRMSEIKDSMHPSRGTLTVLREFVFPNVPAIYRETLRAIDQAGVSVVVTHHIAYGAGWAAEARGVPVAKVVLAPMAWLNPREPSVFRPWGPRDPGPLIMRTQLWLARWLMRWQFDRPLNARRREIGLPPGRDMAFGENFTGSVVLGMWSDRLRGAIEGDPAAGVICGFPTYDRPTHPEFDERGMTAFLDECDRAGEPPVVVTLGTAVVHDAGRFFHHAANALRAIGRRGVLISGRREFLPSPAELPPGVRTFTYAPYSMVFPRGSVNVHHGGIGTTAQGLRAGRPTLITPVAYDQFDNAARCQRLGVSDTLHFHAVTPVRLARALRQVLDDPGCAARARAMGAALAGEDGARVAAERIEAMAHARGVSARA